MAQFIRYFKQSLSSAVSGNDLYSLTNIVAESFLQRHREGALSFLWDSFLATNSLSLYVRALNACLCRIHGMLPVAVGEKVPNDLQARLAAVVTEIVTGLQYDKSIVLSHLDGKSMHLYADERLMNNIESDSFSSADSQFLVALLGSQVICYVASICDAKYLSEIHHQCKANIRDSWLAMPWKSVRGYSSKALASLSTTNHEDFYYFLALMDKVNSLDDSAFEQDYVTLMEGASSTTAAADILIYCSDVLMGLLNIEAERLVQQLLALLTRLMRESSPSGVIHKIFLAEAIQALGKVQSLSSEKALKEELSKCLWQSLSHKDPVIVQSAIISMTRVTVQDPSLSKFLCRVMLVLLLISS